MAKPSVLVTGNSGQLATALKQCGSIVGHPIVAVGRPQLDLTHTGSIDKIIEEIRPLLVINAAAYTAVDKAESEAETATAVNATSVGYLGQICAQNGIPVIHISTDYVFDGKGKTPYKTNDAPSPQGVYGHSKSQGETELRKAVTQHLIFRTAWVFGEHGSNFLRTMMRLGTTHDQIRVVDDQFGTPTYSTDLALAIAEVARQVLTARQGIQWGTYHLTNSGETTWCGFAREIFDNLAKYGAPTPEVIPISTKEYPTPAARPAYSVLDCSKTLENFGIELPDWKDATKRCIEQIEGIGK